MAKSILMIGTARDVRGGISAVVNVYAGHGLFERWNARYVETHCDGGKVRKALKAAHAWINVMALLATRRIALLHVHIASDASFWRKALFIVPADTLGVPYILHMHGGRFLEFYRDHEALVQRFIRRIYRRARVVIALSGEWRDTLLQVSPESRIVVVPNPVLIPPWQAALDTGPATVLFLGLIKESKGVHDLVAAWPAVRRAVAGAHLILGGSGEIDAMRASAQDLQVADSVETPGWIVGEGKDALMKRAWVYALPSHGEALPMSILESMAAGIPVVATRVGGVPTAVLHDRTGILIEVGDVPALSRSLTALLLDESRRKSMGSAARTHMQETFSADTVVPRVEALWREILR